MSEDQGDQEPVNPEKQEPKKPGKHSIDDPGCLFMIGFMALALILGLLQRSGVIQMSEFGCSCGLH